MTDVSTDKPPKVWSWNQENGGRFANINRPIAGPTHNKELPVGRYPLQLYSLATPSGVKVTVMLEELLELGHAGAEYDAWLIRIQEGDQFGSGFVDVNPNVEPALAQRGIDIADDLDPACDRGADTGPIPHESAAPCFLRVIEREAGMLAHGFGMVIAQRQCRTADRRSRQDHMPAAIGLDGQSRENA